MAQPNCDFRSDTVTRPTEAMRAAMAAAPVGDDVMGEDPTVSALEERIAALLGKETAVFVPSGTMSNQIAVKAHTQPGDELICEEFCHIYNWEAGAPALLVSLVALLFEDLGAQRHVQLALDRGAAVVRHVDRARELDELRVERLRGFLHADAVLDVPQRFVHLLELRHERAHVARRQGRGAPRLAQQRQLAPDVRELRRVAHALGLDLEDRELVEELAGRGAGLATGIYTLPGGVVEAGETLTEAVIREVREETAVEIEPVELAGYREMIQRSDDGRTKRHFVIVCFAAHWISGEPVPDLSEISEAAWRDPDELNSLRTTQGLADIVAEAIKQLEMPRL